MIISELREEIYLHFAEGKSYLRLWADLNSAKADLNFREAKY